jgi:hypothetical protein
MINGVLVERTVKDVVPALQINADGLRKVLEDLVKQYNAKQVDMEKWKVSLSPETHIKLKLIVLTEEEQYSGCPAMTSQKHLCKLSNPILRRDKEAGRTNACLKELYA